MTEMTTIGDVAEIFDGPHATPKKTKVGPYFLNIASLQSGRLVLADSAHLSEEDFVRWTKRVTPREGDLLFSYETRLGEAALMPADIKGCLGRRMGILRPKVDKVDPKFLLYSYLGPHFQNEIVANTIKGATVERISISEIGNFKIRVPGKLEQRKIAGVLSAIDDKIDLNNRINAELEALAKTIYDYWFVQFDFPGANGRPYRSSGGKMVWSDALKREIPLGWGVESLWDIADYTNGLAMQKFRPAGDTYLPVIKIREMSDGFTTSTERASPSIPAKCVVNDGDVLFSWSATLSILIWVHGPGALNQHIFKVTSGKYPRSYFYFQLVNYLDHFKMMAEKRKTTMGHITLDHLRQAHIVKPPQSLTKKLDVLLDPILQQRVGLSKQGQKLIELRDWLLPLLMNGQVRVA